MSVLRSAVLVAGLLVAIAGHAQSEDIAGFLEASPAVARFITRQIWRNESGGEVRGLTAWDPGEGHASLGIGHFIWYPPGAQGPYRESFPELLQFLRRRGVAMPAWLAPEDDCPWANRAAFVRSLDEPRMIELRRFLHRTVAVQVAFMAARLEQALPAMVAAVAPDERDHVRTQYRRVLHSSSVGLSAGGLSAAGVYAMLDYVNFKGEGVHPGERYRSEGWGLLQVLQAMPGDSGDPREEFADAAGVVLARRVANAPAGRDERRYLPGWLARLDTYRTAAFDAALAAFDADR